VLPVIEKLFMDSVLTIMLYIKYHVFLLDSQSYSGRDWAKNKAGD